MAGLATTKFILGNGSGNPAAVSMSGDATMSNTGAVTVTGSAGNFTVTGDLTVSGDTTTVNTATLTVEDPLIKLASGNTSGDVIDIGFYGLYDNTGSQDVYTGLTRDASDDKWHLWKLNQAEPTTTVNHSGTGFAVDTLVANLEGDVTGDLTGTAADATVLETARTINGVSFNGSANITVTAAGSTLSDTVTVAKGGTGATTLTNGGVLLGSGTGAITAMGVLSDGQMIVGDGSTDPVAESGATLRTSIGCNPVAGSTDITTLGTIGTGTWQGTAVASAYLDADTAHLTTAQTFTGSKTMGTTVKLNFRDGNSYINSPTANDLEIVATDIVLDAATLITLEQDVVFTDKLYVDDKGGEYISGNGTTATMTGAWAASNMTITGGTVSGITDITIADGGTGASTASAAFTALKQAASASATGVVELATAAEVITGTDAARVVTADTLSAKTVVATIAQSSLTDDLRATITHSLGTADTIVQLFDMTTEAIIHADVGRTTNDMSTASTSVITVDFGTTPPNDVRCIITSLAGATAGSVAYT